MGRDDVDRELFEGGMTPEMAAGSGYGAFKQALKNRGPNNQVLPVWCELPQEAQEGWLQVVNTVMEILLQMSDTPGVSWADVAKECYEKYARCVGRELRIEFKDLPVAQQVAWQAAARHLANCATIEDAKAEDMERHEMSWRAWAENKLAALGGNAGR